MIHHEGTKDTKDTKKKQKKKQNKKLLLTPCPFVSFMPSW